MNKALQLAVILSAYDRMSRVVNDAIGKAEQRLKGFKRVSDSAFSFGRDAAMVGAAIAAPIALATNEAIKFEDKMADVAKVMDLTVGSEAFASMSNDVKNVSKELGMLPDQAAGLTAALAQGGVAKEDLAEITTFAGQVSVAFDIMGETAGDAFVKTRNALGATNEQTKQIFDAINKLSDSDAAKASQIVEFMAAGGAGVARSMGMSGQAAAAFGTSLIAVGKSGSEAATIMDRFKKGILTNDEMKAIYDSAGGGLAGIVRVLDVGANSKDQFAFFNKFGQYGSDIMLMAQNLEHVSTNLNLVGNAQNYSNSVLKEFENRNSTTQGKLNRMRAELNVLAVDIGNGMLPVLVEFQKAVSPIINSISQWVQQNPELAATIVKAAAGAAAFALAIAGISFVVGGVTKAISFGATVFTHAAKAIQFVGTAFRVVSMLFVTNPILLAVAAIAAAVFLIIRNWDSVSAFFVSLWDKVKNIFFAAWDWAKKLFFNFTPLGLFLSHWQDLKPFFDAGMNIVKSIWEGIKSFASKPIEAISNIVKNVREYLPFSPAKRGPLRDIHRIKLIETIADAIKPTPLLDAVSRVTRAAFDFAPNVGLSASGAAAGGGSVSINFSPTINVGGAGGGDVRTQILSTLREYEGELLRMVQNAMERNNRKKY